MFKLILVKNYLEEKKYHNSVTNKKHLLKKFPYLNNLIKENLEFNAQLYCLINNINFPICEYCKQPYKFISYKRGFFKQCSNRCNKKYIDCNIEKLNCNSILVCKKHNTVITTKNYMMLKQYNAETYCKKCAEEKIIKGKYDNKIVEESKENLKELFKNRKKIKIESFKNYFPNLYLKVNEQNNIKPNKFLNKLNYFLYDYDLKCQNENCNNIVSFNKKNNPNIYCKACLYKLNNKVKQNNKQYWIKYLKQNFDIDVKEKDIEIKDKELVILNVCKHHFILNIKKQQLKKYKQIGLKYICIDCNKDYYSRINVDETYNNVIKEKWNFIKNMKENTLLEYDPLLWSYIYKHCLDNDSSFIESKFMIKYDITKKPVCLICEKPAKFSIEAYKYLQHCEDHLTSYFVSKGELQVKKFLDELGIDYISNDRNILNGKELDIYMPSKKIAIEYNGLYWHNEINKSKTSKTYHYNKFEKCKEKGIELITIWEDDWKDKQDVVKSIIIHGLKNKI